MRSGLALGLAAFGLFGCFNPDGSEPDTDSNDGGTAATAADDGTDAATPPETMATGTGGETPEADSTTAGEESGTDTGSDVPSWGEGDAPDFGDLGPDGEGNVLVVHALDLDEPVDVWLVGDADPIATGLQPNDATLVEGLPRDARRVVLSRAGTLEAVACSDWFPLRADEQWATVAARQSHTCPAPVNDGATMTFEQERTLAGNPLRFAHAGVADDLTVHSGAQTEPGTLEPLQTLGVTELPDCSQGCVLPYDVANADLAPPRFFTILATEVADVPPAGEVLVVVRGNVREDWPQEPDSIRLVRVDINGVARPMGRDPEVALYAIGSNGTTEFSTPAPPGSFVIGTASQCDGCTADTPRFAPGTIDVTATSPAGGPLANGSFDLESGHRYALLLAAGELTLIQDDFERGDDTVATGRGLHVFAGPPLTLGHTFAGRGVPFDNFTNMALLEVSDVEDLPLDNWSLLAGTGRGPLGTGCFYGAGTPAGWRGIVGEGFLMGFTAWPPNSEQLGLACF